MKKFIIPFLMLFACNEAVSFAALCIITIFVIVCFVNEAEKKGE